MFVRELHLRDFRSWRSADVTLRPEPTIFVGRNGFGKTNLIEALYYTSTLRSHRVSGDAPLVRSGCASAQITTTVENDGRELTVQIGINADGKNTATINTAPTRRTREVLGILRTVLFAPEDLSLIRGDPADRRRFLDELVAQRGPRYVAARSDYDRVLRQRSALLKTAAGALRRGGSDADSVISTLDVWDAQLAALGAQVTAARLDVLADLTPHFVASYASIAPHSRPAGLRYRAAAGPDVTESERAESHSTATDFTAARGADVTQIEDVLRTRLAEIRSKEIDRGMCLVGPHRDDLDIFLGDDVAKGFASHGESWSLALALRLGSVELSRSEGVEPVIMLDDVFAELDVTRRRTLADYTAGAEQLLVTAAVAEDIPDSIGGRRVRVDLVEDNDGRHSVLGGGGVDAGVPDAGVPDADVSLVEMSDSASSVDGDEQNRVGEAP